MQVLQALRGRGAQLNAGWRAAHGEWVVFLHADSELPAGYTELLAQELQRRDAAARGQEARGQRQRQPKAPQRHSEDDQVHERRIDGMQTGHRRGWWSWLWPVGGRGRGRQKHPQQEQEQEQQQQQQWRQRSCEEPCWGCFSSIRATEVCGVEGFAWCTTGVDMPSLQSRTWYHRGC